MPDLLTHVLVVYSVFTIASWRLGWLGRFVSVGIVGTVIPDLAKVRYILEAEHVSMLLGVPFSWMPIHRLGGAILLAGMGAMFFPREYRRRALAALVAGVAAGFLLDVGLMRANGVTPPYFYPLTWWQPPAGNLYLSSHIWPSMVAILLASGVWIHDRRR